jgi:hypothetical protein
MRSLVGSTPSLFRHPPRRKLHERKDNGDPLAANGTARW